MGFESRMMLFALNCFFLLCSLYLQRSSAQDISGVLNIDLASSTRFEVNGDKFGILHAINTTAPPPAVLDPLPVKMYRGPVAPWLLTSESCDPLSCPLPFEVVPRLVSIESRVQFVLTDLFVTICALLNVWPPPVPGTGADDDLHVWEYTVTSIVNESARGDWTMNFDIFNEPNANASYGYNFTGFYRVWDSAWSIIRTLQPSAVIIGPSVADGGPGINGWQQQQEWLEEFLLHAKTAGTLPDILSWHCSAPINGSEMIDQLQEIKSFIAQNNINITRFALNEILGPEATFNAGITLSYLSALERGNFDHSCHACWQIPGLAPNSSCWDQTLDGLLTQDGNYSPRATWWVAQLYGLMKGISVPLVVSPSTLEIDGLVVIGNTNNSVEIMVGQWGNSGNVSLNVLILNANSVFNSEIINILIESVPNDGIAPLPSPIVTLNTTTTITTENTILFSIPKTLNSGDVFKIYLS